jgi:hypothetical protein
MGFLSQRSAGVPEHERTLLRGYHDDGQAYTRSRLGFLEERNQISVTARAGLNDGKVEERLRLGFCEERTLASDAQRRREVEGKMEERARLGFFEGRSGLSSARRRELAETAMESRSRVGFLVHSPRHPLSKADPAHRTRSTTELRAKVNEVGANLRARAGMVNERTASSDPSYEKRQEGRERLGMCEKPILREKRATTASTARGRLKI